MKLREYKADNGDILFVEHKLDNAVFVVEDVCDEVSMAEKNAQILRQIRDRFFTYEDKYSEDAVNIAIYASPGRKVENIYHVRAFLNHVLFEPSEELIKKVRDIMDEEG